MSRRCAPLPPHQLIYIHTTQQTHSKLFFFKYMVAGGGPDDFLPVATTRPETILGDAAVCVHPEDAR